MTDHGRLYGVAEAIRNANPKVFADLSTAFLRASFRLCPGSWQMSLPACTPSGMEAAKLVLPSHVARTLHAVREGHRALLRVRASSARPRQDTSWGAASQELLLAATAGLLQPFACNPSVGSMVSSVPEHSILQQHMFLLELVKIVVKRFELAHDAVNIIRVATGSFTYETHC